MIYQEPWFKEADSLLREEDEEEFVWPSEEERAEGVPPTPKVRRRNPAWEDDFDVPSEESDTQESGKPGAPPAGAGPSTLDSLDDEFAKILKEFDESMRNSREKLIREEEQRIQEEQRRKEVERIKQETMEKRKRRGRCPFCGGPPHGRGEIGGDA